MLENNHSTTACPAESWVCIPALLFPRRKFTYVFLPTGASAFGGLGAYTYWSGQRQLRLREQEILKSGSKINMAARRLGITSIAAVLIGMGAYRAFV